MRLFFKDLVTDELFPMECQSSDTIDNLKHQFMIHQGLSLSPSDLFIDVFHPQEESYPSHSEMCEMDVTFPCGTLEQYQIEEDDVILFVYHLGA